MARSLICSLLHSDKQIGPAISAALAEGGSYMFVCDDYEHAQNVYCIMATELFDEIRTADPATRTIELYNGGRLTIMLAH